MAFDLQYLQVAKTKNILGLAFPMRLDGVGGFASQNENLGALRDGVMQLIMTSRGARVMRPDYGTDLRKSVFQPLDATILAELKTQITSTITKYEPRVIVKRLELIPDFDRNQLVIKLLIMSKDDLLNAQMVEVVV